jgi:hypothetical protein
MNRVYQTVATLVMLLLFPSTASAEFRRIELKILGMD